MNRSFVRSTLDADHRTSAYKIVCRQCGKTDKVAAGYLSGALPPEVSAKKFRQRGWAVGNRLGDDLCNLCLAANKIARKQPTIESGPVTLKLKDLSKLQELKGLAGGTPPVLGLQPPAAQETPVDKLFTVKEAIEAGWSNMDRMYEYIRKGRLKCVKNERGVFVIPESELNKTFGKPRISSQPLAPIQPAPIVNEKKPALGLPALAVEQKPTLNDGAVKMNFDPKTPHEMTKEDRRIIFADIDLHYLDETRGYETSYDDKRIADGLNVPLAWVRTIREENFGPERGEAINAELDKLKAAKDDIEASISKMRALWSEINKALEAFTVRQNVLSEDAKKSHEAANALMAKIDLITRK